jgi:hypothetical protein
MSKFRFILPISILLFLFTAFVLHQIPKNIIRFSGYDWQVRDDGFGNPGPNKWKKSNVWLDSNGYLHLKITHTGDDWYSAEIQTTRTLGFGEYQFQVVGRIDNLDPNVVLGLFSYSASDSSDEIDIEYTQWGDSESTSGNWAVHPSKSEQEYAHETFPINLNGTYTTNRYTWTSQSVFFQTLNGHHDNNDSQLGSWLYNPSEPLSTIPQQPMIVHINFWLYKGNPPLNGNEAEIILHSFTFRPI